jgi:hypothetical protein
MNVREVTGNTTKEPGMTILEKLDNHLNAAADAVASAYGCDEFSNSDALAESVKHLLSWAKMVTKHLGNDPAIAGCLCHCCEEQPEGASEPSA